LIGWPTAAWQKLADVPEDEFEAALAAPDEPAARAAE